MTKRNVKPKISPELKQALIEAVRNQVAQPVRRLSTRRTIFSLEREGKQIGFVYERETGDIELYNAKRPVTYQIGQKVWWRITDGMIRSGEIVAEVPPNTQVAGLLGRWANAKHDHLLNQDVRAQPSFLVRCETKQGDKMEWPPISALRDAPIINKTRPRKRR